MSFRANPFLERLDRLVAFTGVKGRMRRAEQGAIMRFRVAPLLPLAFAAAGLFLQMWLPPSGWLVLIGAWAMALPLYVAGPMKAPPSGERRDEFESALFRLGQCAGLAAAALLAVGGCFLFGVMSALSIFHHWAVWLPRLPGDWVALGLFLIVVHHSVAVLAVSWKIPRVPDVDEG